MPRFALLADGNVALTHFRCAQCNQDVHWSEARRQWEAME
jgi:hypothetical protein